MGNLTLDAILVRVAEIIGSDKDTDIAEALDAGRSSLSTWRKRDHVPYKNIVEFCLKREVPIESVLTGNFRKSEQIYKKPEEALSVVLDVQSELNLMFTADQIKSMLEYAYRSQSGKEDLISFVQAAFSIANKELPVSTQD